MMRARLFAAGQVRISQGMRTIPFVLALALLPLAALAAPAKAPDAPPRKSIGSFDDWQAATNVEAGQTVCYAFTRGKAPSRKLPGRGDVVLTVTHRGTERDEVALSAGFAYGANASVVVQADKQSFAFYTAQRYAFARDRQAVVAVLQKSSTITARSPVPKAADMIDSFSLKGFKAAYEAINKACPGK